MKKSLFFLFSFILCFVLRPLSLSAGEVSTAAVVAPPAAAAPAPPASPAPAPQDPAQPPRPSVLPPAPAPEQQTLPPQQPAPAATAPQALPPLTPSVLQKMPPLAPAQATQVQPAALPAVLPYKIYDLKDGPGFCIYGGQSGKSFNNEAAFWSVVWKSDVVYVGESHDQIKDHLAQLAALKALQMRRAAKVAVGFEMLNVTLQPVLDDYISGKITEAEFLVKADWAHEWGFDFGLYKPLFDYIIQNKLRALALNLPKKVVSKIARAGLAGLDAEEKKFLPEQVNITKNQKYLDFLKASFDGHGGSPMAKLFTWDNYLASMAAWNEAMGAKIADFVKGNPGWSVLVVAGNGHIMYNAAIPASVKSRTEKVYQASFYTEEAAACPAALPKTAKDTANYMWYINHAPKKKK